MARRYRFPRIAVVGIAALLGLALAVGGGLLYRRVVRALALSQALQADIARADVAASCRDVTAAQAAWRSAATLSRPLTPLLHGLGWAPRLGADLRALPEAIALAEHGTAAGAAACTLVQPVVALPPGPARTAAAVNALRDQADQLALIRDHLAAAQDAYALLAPQIERSPRLAPYQSQLATLGAQLPRAIAAFDMAEDIAPQLPWLLGLEQPRRFVLVVQNPFELRPTGGFIGLVCTITVANAQPGVEGCRPSEAYTAPAPDLPMPVPYTRYLRLGGYYLRDANWSPDFTTTARTIEQFWARNDGPPVDGVIAVDPYALTPLLEATGPLTLADGSQIDAANATETILARYYDGAVYRDKSLLAQFLPALLQRLKTVQPAEVPRMAAALRTALDERHVLIALNQPELAAALDAQGWAGTLPARTSDSLRVVDADVGYGAVNAFVDRLTQYDVALDRDLAPLTATLTLTYTNRYSPWAEAPTAYAVNGDCTDPGTLQATRQPGCYANFVRVYAPLGSRLLEVAGLEESLGVDQEGGRTVFGGYLRINPGEYKVVQLRYRLPQFAPGSLTIEKQPGTPAPPLLITARMADQRAALYSAGRTDVEVRFTRSNGTLALSGPADDHATSLFAQHAAYVAGLEQWQAGARAAAIQTWQTAGVLDRALDQARLRAADGAPTDALLLLQAIIAVAPDGRAAWEQATVLETLGRAAEAEPFFVQATQHSPDHPLAQLTYARRLAAAQHPLPSLQQLSPASSAVRRWRSATTALEQTGDRAATLAYQAVLLAITPDDRALALRHADLLRQAGQTEAALTQYAALARNDDLWGRLARARTAQIASDRATAITVYAAALPLATSYDQAFSIGDGLRDLGDTAGALQAYEQAAAMPPGSIWPLIAAGNMLRGADPAAAQTLYSRAQQADPSSGYPDWALGSLLLTRGEVAAALPLLEAAADKQPDVMAFQTTLIAAQQPATR